MKTITNFHNIEEFETTHLLARRVREDDFDLLLPMYQNPDVMKTLGGLVTPEVARERIEFHLAIWKRKHCGMWLWFDKQSHELVARGGIGEKEIEGRVEVEVGYSLMPKYWNRGLATEIARASIEIAFLHVKLPDLICITTLANQASQKVMQKAGFHLDKNVTYQNEQFVLYRLSQKQYLESLKS